MVGYSQSIAVTNYVNTKYEIKALYVNSNNITTEQIFTVPANYLQLSIPYEYPTSSGNYLYKFKVYTANCNPLNIAIFNYGTSGEDWVYDCHTCEPGNNGKAYNKTSNHTLAIRCTP